MMNVTLKRPVGRLDVRVIGIGGAGCSLLRNLSDCLPGETRFLGIDTGNGVSGLRAIAEVIQIGNGFGSGGDTAVAEGLFAGSGADVSSFVAGADVVIIVAGLGRGTGSGISPLVARVSKDSGALTLATVSQPFEFEGRSRNQAAARASNRLQVSADSVIVTGNGEPSKSARSTGSPLLAEAFAERNSKTLNAIRAVIQVLMASGTRFNEVKDSLRSSGDLAVLSGTSSGLHGGRTAVERAFGNMSSGISGVAGALDLSRVKSAVLHVEGGIGLSAGQVEEAVAGVRARAGRLTELHVSCVREVAKGRQVRVTLMLAGSVPEPGNMEQFASSSSSTWSSRLRRPAAVTVFDTPRPVRRRGPVLLPVG